MRYPMRRAASLGSTQTLCGRMRTNEAVLISLRFLAGEMSRFLPAGLAEISVCVNNMRAARNTAGSRLPSRVVWSTVDWTAGDDQPRRAGARRERAVCIVPLAVSGCGWPSRMRTHRRD